MKKKIVDPEFGMRVKFLADRVGGMSNLARLCGISLSMIKKYVSGEADPSRTSLLSLAASGHIAFDWLGTGEGSIESGQLDEVNKRAPQSEQNLNFVSPDPSLQHIFDAFMEVMTSEETGTKTALIQNTLEFRDAIRNKKEIAEMKRDMDIIKKRIFGEADKDLKTEGLQEGENATPGKAQREGGQ